MRKNTQTAFRKSLEHPTTIATNYLNVYTIDNVMSDENPSDYTYLVLNSILCSLDEPESWQRAQKLTRNRKEFLERLRDYPCDQMTPAQIQRLEKYTLHPKYSPETILAESTDLALLAEWVIALVSYGRGRVQHVRQRES